MSASLGFAAGQARITPSTSSGLFSANICECNPPIDDPHAMTVFVVGNFVLKVAINSLLAASASVALTP